MGRPRKTDEGEDPATKRVQMELAPSSLARLQRIQRRTEAASYAETVRNALIVNERLLDAMRDGGSLTIRKGDSETILLLISEDTERTTAPSGDGNTQGSER
jgi:hypothetical protein